MKELGLDLNNDRFSDNLVVLLKDRIIMLFGENLLVLLYLIEGWVMDCEYFFDLMENEVYNYFVLSKCIFDLN